MSRYRHNKRAGSGPPSIHREPPADSLLRRKAIAEITECGTWTQSDFDGLALKTIKMMGAAIKAIVSPRGR